MTRGSMFACSVADDTFGGAHLVGGGKAVHANEMGRGGNYYYAHYTADTTADVAPRTSLQPQQTRPSANALDTKTVFKVEHSVVNTEQIVGASPERVVNRSIDAPVVDPSLIADINRATDQWRAGPNTARFGNMTRRLLRETLLRTGPWSHAPPQQAAAHALRATSPSTYFTAPDSFDSRTQWPSCVGGIRDQARCGSCWAFGAAEALSDRVCIASEDEVHTDLSVDYLIVCDTLHDQGCQGGFLQCDHCDMSMATAILELLAEIGCVFGGTLSDATAGMYGTFWWQMATHQRSASPTRHRRGRPVARARSNAQIAAHQDSNDRPQSVRRRAHQCPVCAFTVFVIAIASCLIDCARLRQLCRWQCRAPRD